MRAIAVEEQDAVALASTEYSDAEYFIRRLLGLLAQQDAPESLVWNDSEAQSIILDIAVDGVRYTLIRTVPSPKSYTSLSPREREIARLIAKGLPNKAIAAILEISPWTVATHLRRIFVKLSVSSRAEMIARMRNVDLLAEPVSGTIVN